ncbi:hypothetical protein GGS20DRAFT_584909 [Poronia punctata]|nr:hypothetical protein GGS20DRAFT_584909 [Poronia punctata]
MSENLEEKSQEQGHHNRPDPSQRLPRTLRALKDSKHEKDHPRTIVICLDGTGDQFDNDNSNIVHFVSCLKKHSPEKQVTYYQSGIGTYDKGGLKNGIGAALDMAVGSGLGIHIKDAYRFLMQNYREGDKICLIGFSRGAYTVRCLAGMIHKVGLLPASNGSQVNFAYDFYKDDTPNGEYLAREFKKTFCTEVSVYFLGVFDCVASVGFFPRKLPFSKTATNTVRYFRHAMALDEHRAKFKVCHWQQQQPGDTPDVKRRNTIDFTPVARLKRGVVKQVRKNHKTPQGMQAPPEKQHEHEHHHKHKKHQHHQNGNGNGHTNGNCEPDNDNDNDDSDSSTQDWESKFQAQEKENHRYQDFTTDALEVWFKGCHADIGGGAVDNESRHMLSRIPLRWMIRQCFECDTGILFDMTRLAEQGIDVHNLHPVYRAPCKPSGTPTPKLAKKHRKGTLAPVQRRSIFLPIGDGDRIEGAPSMDDLNYVLPSEGDEDHFDAMEETCDMLKLAKGWWVLEVWPVKIRVLSKDNEAWEKRVRINLGRYRAIRNRNPNIHWTVQKMIDEGKYEIKCRQTNGTKWREVI